MLRFLHSIFGSDKPGSYPESLVAAAIERAVDGTDPWLRAVSGYKKKLRHPVLCAIDHVVALVDALPPPIPVRLGSHGEEDPRLKSFFISAVHMRKFFSGNQVLADFLQGPGSGSAQVTTLLAMEKQEKTILGAALSGDVVVRDIPQITVNFDGHRLIDPSATEEDTRRLLKRRAYDHLLSLALKLLTLLKSQREDLQRRRELLQAKLNLLKREGWGFDERNASEKMDVAEVEGRLGQIEAQLKEMGGDDRMLETYLGVVADVMGRPREYLYGRKETIFVDRMGIKRTEAAADAPEISLTELYNAEGRSLVVTLVSIRREELEGGWSNSAAHPNKGGPSCL